MVVDEQQRVEELVERLRKSGHRVTPQRVAVLRALLSGAGHPTAEEIHGGVEANFPMTSLATVYKTLGLLREMGEVAEIEVGDGAKRYDVLNPFAHAHLRCENCQEIVDLVDLEFEGLLEQVEETTGYGILSHHIDFRGVCPRCRQKMQE